MKKTKYIELVLITAALSSCHQPGNKDWESANTHTYIRSDSSAPYSPVRYHGEL